MNEKTELLRSLRIDRKERAGPGILTGDARRWPIVAALAMLAVACLGTLVWLRHDTMPSVRVGIAEVSPSGLARPVSSLDASGYIVARRQATVSSKVTGRLQQLFIEEGQHVTQDQVLARLDDTNAQAAVNEAEATVKQAEMEVRRARTAEVDARPVYTRDQQLAAAGVISAEAMENSTAKYHAEQADLLVAQGNLEVRMAERASALRNEDDTIIKAPFAGVITSKNAQPGEIVSPLSAAGAYTRSGIGTLVDMSSLEIDVDVSENFISRIRLGGRAEMKLNAYPDWVVPAYVLAIVPTADRNKATFRVRVGFDSTDSRILPEMGARVSFLSSGETHVAGADTSRRDELSAPAEAVKSDSSGSDGQGVVFVLHDSLLERRVVKLGALEQGRRIVESGIAPGDRLAIGDFSQMADGERVHVINP